MMTMVQSLRRVCQVTHPQLYEGLCPWCEHILSYGEPEPVESPDSVEPPRWNLDRIFDDLEHGTADIQGITLANLRGYSSAEWRNERTTLAMAHELGHFVCADRSDILRVLEKAESIEPEVSHWPSILGMLYFRWVCERWSLEDEIKREFRRNAVAALERALAIETDRVGCSAFLYALITIALEAREMEKAGELAERLLSVTASIARDSGWSVEVGDGNHLAHTVLGRLALLRDDRETAKDHLLTSVEPKGGGVLNSFGPRMALAEALLKLGEAQVVILYLRLCSNFWEMDNGRLKRWIGEIEQDILPDFGMNLHW